MVKPLSLDLRKRIVAAVAGGMSRRKAAERFGVSPASAVRYCALDAKQGDARPRPQGGDRHSHKIEAHADFILDAVARKSDVTLVELRALLAQKGVSVAVSTLWRLFNRRRITFKKDCARQRTEPSRCPEAARGMVRGPTRSRSGPPRLYRRNLVLDQYGPHTRPRSQRRALAGQRPPWTLENHDICCGFAAGRQGRAARP